MDCEYKGWIPTSILEMALPYAQCLFVESVRKMATSLWEWFCNFLLHNTYRRNQLYWAEITRLFVTLENKNMVEGIGMETNMKLWWVSTLIQVVDGLRVQRMDSYNNLGNGTSNSTIPIRRIHQRVSYHSLGNSISATSFVRRWPI